MNNPKPEDEYITRTDLATRWGVSYMTIRRRQWEGKLDPVRQPSLNPIRYRMDQVRAVEAGR